MKKEPWAKFTMRVTPKTMVRPQAVMNSDEALASPFSAWMRRKAGSVISSPPPCGEVGAKRRVGVPALNPSILALRAERLPWRAPRSLLDVGAGTPTRRLRRRPPRKGEARGKAGPIRAAYDL